MGDQELGEVTQRVTPSSNHYQLHTKNGHGLKVPSPAFREVEGAADPMGSLSGQPSRKGKLLFQRQTVSR